MIIQFPNGAGVDSSVIASIHVQDAREGQHGNPARIQVYIFRNSDPFGMGMFGGKQRPSAEHFMGIEMPSTEEAQKACRELVAKWMGLPAQMTADSASPSTSVTK